MLSEIYGNVYGTLNLADVAERLSLRRSQWVMGVAHLLRAGIFLAPDGKSLKITDLEALVFKDNASLLGSSFSAPSANAMPQAGFISPSPVPADLSAPNTPYSNPGSVAPPATPFGGVGAFQGFNTGSFFASPVIPPDAPDATGSDGGRGA